MTLSYGNT